MSKAVLRYVPLIAAGVLCFALTGCESDMEDSVLNQQANYNVSISLPYVTVQPTADNQEAGQALVIDAAGSVTVNDSSSILNDEFSASDNDTADGNYKSLSLGNTGIAVQALQTRLRELNYYTADVSGIFDTNTETAVRRFEQSYGTMQTGVATAKLQTRLFNADAPVYGSDAYNNAVLSQYTVLERGDVGSSVYALQQRLQNLGYPIATLSGTFDNETANAVMLFYEAYGLSTDDVATVSMQQVLYSDSAKTYGNVGTSNIGTSSSSINDSEQLLSDYGLTVDDMQKRLIELGYLEGSASGRFDSATETGIKLFEQACGQLATGTLTADLARLMASDNAPLFSTYASQYANLLEGSSGDEVARLQTRLVQLGFASGTPNGDYGSATTEAVRLFQHVNGLSETGVASRYSQAVLFSSFALNFNGKNVRAGEGEVPAAESTDAPVVSENALYETLKTGASGDAVSKLQNRLTELGYVASLTGDYDDLTARAISAFQTSIGVNADGIATNELQMFIYSKAAPNSSYKLYGETQGFQPLRETDTGDSVTNLQRRLWELGYLAQGDVENSIGIYNAATAAAVSAIENVMGYETTDGIAGAEFQCFLFSDYGNALKKE